MQIVTKRNNLNPFFRKSATQIQNSDHLGTAFACFIPMLIFLEVNLIGRLFVSEILLIFILPFLLKARGSLLLTPLPKKLLLLGIAWLFSQIITDLIRSTPFEDWSRGWSKIAFLLLNFSAIYLYLNRRAKRFLFFEVGIAIGQILVYFLNPNIYSDGLPWKFGYGFAITIFVLLATQLNILKKRILAQALIMISFALINFYIGFRSLALICGLTAVIVFSSGPNRFIFMKRNWLSVIILFLLVSLAAYGLLGIYKYGASEGYFNEIAQSEYFTQSSGDLGILVGGRTEILGSIQAVIDSPLIGHGSWAKNIKYAEIMQSLLYQYGYSIQKTPKTDIIPSHSYIMGAWVDAGLMGALFWLWVLILTVRTIVAVFGTKFELKNLIAFVAFSLIWDIPFSPFGAEGRIYVAYYLSLMIFAITNSRILIQKEML